MLKHTHSLWAIAAAAGCLVLNAGCSTEDTPLGESNFSTTQPVTTTYAFSQQLDHNSAEDRDSRRIFVAYAADEPPTVPQAPMPVLYLLHDYLGDAGYYERYSLQALLDEMFANDEIGRMIVVTVDASNYFGGSYYRNSETTGDYEDVLDATIAGVEAVFRVHTRAGKAARAISGHGMGAFGAMRYALDHDDMFGSVSSMSGPLSFGDPAAGTGFWSEDGLIPTILIQNGTYRGDPDLYTKLHDGAGFYLETTMFFAMASAFSPHTLRVFDSLGTVLVRRFPFPNRYDTLYNQPLYHYPPAGANTISFPSEVDTFGVGVDIPFDQAGNLTDSIWALWRDSADVKNVFLQKLLVNPSIWNDPTIDTMIWLDVGLDDELGYLWQNQDFHQALTEAGVPHHYEEFGSSGSLAANHSDQLFSRLRRIIKFHSDNFESSGGRPPGPSAP